MTENIFSFIKKIIRHIPDKNFITVRYYGIYANKNHTYKDHYPKMYTKNQIETLRTYLYWKESLLAEFNYDVLKCECGHVMYKSRSYINDKNEKDGYREIIYVKEKNSKSTTGNPSQVIAQLDTEIKYVIDYFNKNNIPYHLENGIPIREDLPDYIDMMCVKCKHEHKMDYDTYMELLEEIDPFEEMEYLVIECIKCHDGDMIPKKYYLKHLL